MLLILSADDDEHVQLVTPELDAFGCDYLHFDPGHFPADAEFILGIGVGSVASPILSFRGREYDLSSVTAVWNRRPNAPTPNADIEEATVRTWVEHAARHFLDGIWDLLDCPWLPAKPVVDRTAHNKLKQLALACQLGFSIPETLITNAPSKFIRFYAANPGGLVSKSLINQPVRVEGHEIPVMYTRPVYRRDALRYASVRKAPVIFQESVRKRVEIRATVVGRRVFAAEIHSQEHVSTLHDWRHYDDERVRYAVHELPTDIECRLVILVEKLGLCFGAIDLILTPSGEYVLLEINPNGQWGFIEHLTGLPIAGAVAQFLAARCASG